MATQILDQKLVGEEIVYSFSFLSRIALGESVTTASATIEVISGVDPSVLTMLSGLAIVSGSDVNQKVIQGLPGVLYLITVAARTNLNNILLNTATLAVLPNAPVTPP